MNRVAVLSLTDEQRTTLERWVRAGTTPQRLAFRRVPLFSPFPTLRRSPGAVSICGAVCDRSRSVRASISCSTARGCQAIDADLALVTADAAYDTLAFYETATARGATIVIPPDKTARVYAILRGRRVAIVATTVLSVFAREFGLVAVLFGIHRDLRRRISPLAVAATYLPAIVGFIALRQWVMSTEDLGLYGGLLSTADVIANVRLLVDPLFLVMLGYFALTVFGGISLLLLLRGVRGQLRLDGETEWLTYLAVIGTAVPDRLLHHSFTVNIRGDSYRLREN